jgi:site-specific recombinase XerD
MAKGCAASRSHEHGSRTSTTAPARSRYEARAAPTAPYVGQIVTRALYDLGVKSGADDGVSPHALRHTALTEAIEGGASLAVVQRFAGHTNPANTYRYTIGAVVDLRQVHELRR